MYYDQIRHRHSQVLAATGLTPVEFDALLVTFKYHWDEYITAISLWKAKCVHVYLTTGRPVCCL